MLTLMADAPALRSTVTPASTAVVGLEAVLDGERVDVDDDGVRPAWAMTPV